MRELIETVRAWREAGVEAGRAVVVRTFGSAPRPEGAVLLAAPDGRIAGSVSGGCVEGAAAEEIARARRDGVARVVRYGISDAEAWDVGLACGGTIDVLIEPSIRPEVLAAAESPAARAVATLLPSDAPPKVREPHPTGEGQAPGPAVVVGPGGTVIAGGLGATAPDDAGAAAARGGWGPRAPPAGGGGGGGVAARRRQVSRRRRPARGRRTPGLHRGLSGPAAARRRRCGPGGDPARLDGADARV